MLIKAVCAPAAGSGLIPLSPAIVIKRPGQFEIYGVNQNKKFSVIFGFITHYRFFGKILLVKLTEKFIF
jgi:hypothetical protein